MLHGTVRPTLDVSPSSYTGVPQAVAPLLSMTISLRNLMTACS